MRLGAVNVIGFMIRFRFIRRVAPSSWSGRGRTLLFSSYLRQNDGVNRISRVNTSSRPKSMARLQIHIWRSLSDA